MKVTVLNAFWRLLIGRSMSKEIVLRVLRLSCSYSAIFVIRVANFAILL